MLFRCAQNSSLQLSSLQFCRQLPEISEEDFSLKTCVSGWKKDFIIQQKGPKKVQNNLNLWQKQELVVTLTVAVAPKVYITAVVTATADVIYWTDSKY